MYVKTNGCKNYVHCDRSSIDPSQQNLLLIHGSGMDHRVWLQQIDELSDQGINVFAPDMPGHGQSESLAIDNIEEMGQWVWELLDAIGLDQCCLVGHSMGGLVALEAACQSPGQTLSLSLLATADNMSVNQHLLAAAEAEPEVASALIYKWGFSESYQRLMSSSPIIISSFLNNVEANPLYTDLKACNDYKVNLDCLNQLEAPIQCILGEEDRMVTINGAMALADSMLNLQSMVELKCGHMIPLEAADECMMALVSFHQRYLL